MYGTRRVGIALFYASLVSLAAGCSGGGGGAAKDHEPVATDDTATTAEDTATDVDVLANDTDSDTTDILTVDTVSTPAHGAAAVVNGKIHYVPAADFNGTDTFTYTVSDGRTFTPAPTATVTITITAVNDAPVGVSHSATTAEDTATDVDASATDTDVDGDALTITAVTTPAHGAATIVSNKIHYVPAANFAGADSVGYTLSDGNGGSASGTVAITVTPVDDAPVAAADAWSGVEDTTLSIPAPGVLGNDTDVDGPALTAVLVAQATQGSVTLNANGSFSYVPNDNANGTDSFTYKANDGTLNSGTVTVTLTIAPSNDAPSANADAYNATEDTTLTVNAATGVLANDSDLDSATITASLVSGPSKGALSLAADGSFTYTPNANANGADSFQYQASDSSLLSNVATVTITIAPADDAPVANSDSYTTNEDTPLTVNAATGVLANDTDVDTAAAGLTASLVTDGTKGSVSLSANGAFVYNPNANATGTDTFTYKVNDGTLDSGTATVTVSLTTVNDAPSFTAGGNQTALEDAGAQSATGWASAISVGPADESAQAVSFQVSSDNPSLFSAGPSVAGNGTLTYTPAANANGVANVTVKAHDDGGTANGGADTSAGQTFTITVTAVNDAPAFTKGANVTVAEDSGAYVNPWATAISAGPANESAQGLTFVVTGDTNGSLFSLPPAVTPGGVLSFETAANASGVATITLHLQDDGGTANGGVDSTSSQTFTITVSAVDDPPVAKDDFVSGTENAASTIPIASLLANDSDLDGPSATVDLGNLLQPANGHVSISGTDLVYTPNLNFHGTDLFQYRDTDNTLFSPFATVHVEVAVHDAPPSFVAGGNVNVAQDSGAYAAAAAWASSLSQGAGESGQALSFSVVVSNASLFSAGPAIDPTGHLTFTPAAGQSGSSTVAVTLHDDNGSAADPTDDAASAPQVFTISVAPVPSFDVAGDVSLNEGDGPQSIPNFARNIVHVPGGYSFNVYFDNGSLFDFGCSPVCGNPQIDGAGTLSFRLQPGSSGASGTANLTAVLTDASGAQASRTFAIHVAFQNQPPTFDLLQSSFVLQDSDSSPVFFSNVASNLFPGAFNEFNQALSFTLQVSDPTVFVTAPFIDSSGTLHLDPNGSAGAGEVVTISVTLDDDGKQPNGNPGTPAHSATQDITLTFHDHTQFPKFVGSTPGDGSFVNSQTSNLLLPAQLFFDSPDLDCDGMRTAVDITITDLTQPGAASANVLCAGDSGSSVPAGQIWLQFNPLDSVQSGDQIQIQVDHIHGVTTGGDTSATVLFTVDDKPPTAFYIASANNPFGPGPCQPSNLRAIFQFENDTGTQPDMMDATLSTAFVFELSTGPGTGTPVTPEPNGGLGFASLDNAGDTFYFVPRDLLAGGFYQIDLSKLTDVAGNPVQNASQFQNFNVCGSGPGGGSAGPGEPALSRIAFVSPSNAEDLSIPSSQIANRGFLADNLIDGLNDDVVVHFDQPLGSVNEAQLSLDGHDGNNGFNVNGFPSGDTLFFDLRNNVSGFQWQTGSPYTLSYEVCGQGPTSSCTGQSLTFYVQSVGATAVPQVAAIATRQGKPGAPATPSLRPDEPLYLGLTDAVDPRTLSSSNLVLTDANTSFPVKIASTDCNFAKFCYAIRALDAADRQIALPTGSYSLSVSGLLDLNEPQNPVPPASFAFTVDASGPTPTLLGTSPIGGEKLVGGGATSAGAGLFLSFDDLMSSDSFSDTGDPGTTARGFSLTELFEGSLGIAYQIPKKGLAVGFPGCCGGNTERIDDPLSTVELAFQPGGSINVDGFDIGRDYELTPLAGLANIDGTPVGVDGSPIDFTITNDTDVTAFPTLQQYSFGGQLFPDGTFTCSNCGGGGGGGGLGSELDAVVSYDQVSGPSTFEVNTFLGGKSVGNGGNGQIQSTASFGPAEIPSYFTPGDNEVGFDVVDASSNTVSTAFGFHLPSLPAAPDATVGTNGLVTISGTVSTADGFAVARVAVGIFLTDDSSGTPDLQGNGPGTLASVTRHADGSLSYSSTFDPQSFPPLGSGQAYHAIIAIDVPNGLTHNSFSGGGSGGGGGDKNTGSIDAYAMSAAIPVAGPTQPPGTISGTVNDLPSNGAPLPGATVDIESISGSSVTGSNGRWSLPLPVSLSGQIGYAHSTGSTGYWDGLAPVVVPAGGSVPGVTIGTISDAFAASGASGTVWSNANAVVILQSTTGTALPTITLSATSDAVWIPDPSGKIAVFGDVDPSAGTTGVTFGASCRIVTPGGSETSPYSTEVAVHTVTFLQVACP